MEKYIRNFGNILKDNVYSIVTGRFVEGDTDLNALCNLALMRIDRKLTKAAKKKAPRLSPSQKKEIRKFYQPYICRMSDRYHRIYTNASRRGFYPEYIPEDLFFMDIDRFFNQRKEAALLDNKCYYYRLLSNVRQPDLVAMRIGHNWLDSQLKLIPAKKVISLLRKEPSVVVKRAVNSEGGFGVTFLEKEDMIEKFKKLIRTIPCDVVIQRPVKQHCSMEELHPESVNTLRMISMLEKDKVKIYAVIVRIGVGKDRVDNASHGGIICGVHKDGRIDACGVMHNGEIVEVHPDVQYKFSDKRIPGIEDAYALVKEAHAFLGHFRLAAWDVAIDEHGKAVLIEVNLSLGGINEIQICTGPLFGKDTKKILDEVYHNRRRKWTSIL